MNNDPVGPLPTSTPTKTNSTERLTPKIFPLTTVPLASGRVSRAIPKVQLRSIGPWCFLDRFGNLEDLTNDVSVGPHPHIGLQTLTWLMSGRMYHSDSLGSEQRLEPHQLNLMTAGRGIAHAEAVERNGSSPATPVVGAQLWLALPQLLASVAPAFNHYPDLPQLATQAWKGTLILGTFLDTVSPARLDQPALALEITILRDRGELDLDPTFEYGLLPFDSPLVVDDVVLPPTHCAFLPAGASSRRIGGSQGATALLIGGPPLAQPIVMWWNYVGHSREEVVQAHQDWKIGSDRFGDLGRRSDRMTSPKPPWSSTTQGTL